jgi:hypothetical protein
VIVQRKAEGLPYKAIAAELNARGLRPQRATAFTATHVADLHYAFRQRQAKRGGEGLDEA